MCQGLIPFLVSEYAVALCSTLRYNGCCEGVQPGHGKGTETQKATTRGIQNKAHNAVTRHAWPPWRSEVTSNPRRSVVLLMSLLCSVPCPDVLGCCYASTR
jgi:hypothetical protein